MQHEPEYLQARRRLKRKVECFLWMIAGALLAVLIVISMTGGGTPSADATPTAKPVVCKERCQLTRQLNAVCPSQPDAMPRSTCIHWVQVAQCEAGGQEKRVTLTSIRGIGWRHNGAFDGGLQFRESTWTSNMNRIPAVQLTRPQRQARNRGEYAYAYSAPPSVQILAAEVLRRREGLSPWPHCRAWW